MGQPLSEGGRGLGGGRTGFLVQRPESGLIDKCNGK